MANLLNEVPEFRKGALDLSKGIITTLRWIPGAGWILKIRDGRKSSGKKKPIKVPSCMPHETGPVRCKD